MWHKAIVPISALLLGASILLLGNGLLGVLIPVRAGLEGFPTSAIGLIASAYSLGYLASCYVTPHIVRRVGHIRTFAVLAACASSLVLGMVLLVNPWSWFLLRILTGFCLAGLFMVIESWLNEQSSNTNRGQIFSTYMMINLGSITLGQMLLPTGDPAGFTLFAIACIAITVALVPLGLTTSAAPAPLGHVRLRLGRLYRMSPVGVIGCLVIGLANGAYGGMGAVFAQQVGLNLSQVALFMSVSLLGGVLAQYPVGHLSDRMDRRLVIIGMCLGALGSGVLLALLGGLFDFSGTLGRGVLIALSALFGAFVYTQYSLCVAHTNDFIDAADFVEASSGLLLAYGVGASIGPFVAALVMEWTYPGALFIYTALIHGLFVLFTLYRMTRRAALPPEQREEFIPAGGARTTPAAIEFDPRSPEHHDPPVAAERN
ncbi:MAG: MFS transporter [Candidatus Competibacterales bacterium]|nr:MFS transporter [Candidatus Competibacterales bacterium]